MITLPEHASEKSTYRITAAFYDSSNNAVTPSAANFTLLDGGGNICNNRNAVVISSLNTSVDIVLSGNDFAAGNNEGVDTWTRYLLLQATYSSTEGSGLPLKEMCRLYVDNLLGVT